MARFTPRHQTILVCFLLAVVTFGLYLPVTKFDFLVYDDRGYVTKNPHVVSGLTLQNMQWAFETTEKANWHPLTWLSYMLDCQLFGVNAARSHLINLCFHVVNALLLFLFWKRATGALWPSAFVAALFAWHPLHVESVAWIAERKDVLSTFFWILTLWAYGKYALRDGGCVPELKSKIRISKSETNSKPEREGIGKQNAQPLSPRLLLRIFHLVSDFGFRISDLGNGVRGRWAYYCLAFAFFGLGLMSKPMLVTLPFVLLLLDLWPLRRIPRSRAAASPVNNGAGVPPALAASRARRPEDRRDACPTISRLLLEKIPFFLLSALSSYMTFFAQKSGGAMADTTEFPLGVRLSNALVSYSSYIGKMVWPTNLIIPYPYPHGIRLWPVFGAGLALGVISICALLQVRRRPYLLIGWLWFLGTLVPVIGLVQVGLQSMADRYTYVPLIGLFVMFAWGCSEVCRQRLPAKWNLEVCGSALGGIILLGCVAATWRQLPHWKNSETLFEHTLKITPDNAIANHNLGAFYVEQGELDEGIEYLSRSLENGVNLEGTHRNLSLALMQKGRVQEAIEHLRMAVKLEPDSAQLRLDLGVALADQGIIDEAISQYREALRLNPNSAETLNNLAWLLASCPDPKYRNGTEAVRLGELACASTSQPVAALVGTLAAAYAETGQFLKAIETGEKARALALATGQVELAAKNQKLLELYRSGKTYYESRRSNQTLLPPQK